MTGVINKNGTYTIIYNHIWVTSRKTFVQFMLNNRKLDLDCKTMICRTKITTKLGIQYLVTNVSISIGYSLGYENRDLRYICYQRKMLFEA